MALDSKITIDSKYYRVISEGYEREVIPSKTVRDGVLGNTIISIGPGTSNQPARAILFVDYTPATGYGSLVDLTTAAEKAYVSYTDHITSESTIFGSGTFNITILTFKVLLLPGATMPTTGFLAAVEWQKVLS